MQLTLLEPFFKKKHRKKAILSIKFLLIKQYKYIYKEKSNMTSHSIWKTEMSTINYKLKF